MPEVEWITEEWSGDPLPFYHHGAWSERFPWLLQGVTGGRNRETATDYGLFGDAPVGEVLARWEQLRAATGAARVMHSRQVHGAELLAHGSEGPPGLFVGNGHDGHITGASGVILTVSVADCVPVYLVDVERRRVGLVHAGWRGVAAGIVERAIDQLVDGVGEAGTIWLHCGPSICGRCYEVGPEVHAAIHPAQAPPTQPAPIDLGAAIVERAERAGVEAGRISRSAHCTRCGDAGFFSHRGGSTARQIAFLGLRS